MFFVSNTLLPNRFLSLSQQEEITDLKLKLALLEKTEEEYTNNIDNIDHQIQSIINEFQPRVESIQREKETTEKNELQIYSDMVRQT